MSAAPAPEVLDIAGHRESCPACHARSLCPAGQRIVAAARAALLKAAGARRGRMAEA